MQYHNGRINETQIEKAVDQKVIEKQMVNSIESPTISNNDVEPLPHEIEQQKKLQKKKGNRGLFSQERGCFNRFENKTIFFRKQKRFR